MSHTILNLEEKMILIWGEYMILSRGEFVILIWGKYLQSMILI